MVNILIVGAGFQLMMEIKDSLVAARYNLTVVPNYEMASNEISNNDYNLILLNYNQNSNYFIQKMQLDIPLILMITVEQKSNILELLEDESLSYLVKDNCFSQFLSFLVDQNLGLQKNKSTYYESLFKNSAQILLLINPTTGEIVDANKKAVAFYGWSKEQLITKTIQEINTLSKEEVFAEMKAAKEEKRDYFQFKHRLANGQIKNVEVYSAPLIINGEKLLYSMIYDITEREELKEELAWQEEKYKILFETTGTATVIIEEDMTISLANQQMTELSGYSKRELEGQKRWIDFVAYEEELKKLREYHLARRKQSEGEETPPNNYEFHFKDRFGTIKNVLINIELLPNKEQSIASLNDITELKLKEEKLNQNLEQASKLHQNFLPQSVIELDNIVIASYYSPAEELGGDFYNFKQIGSKLIFYLADVSGHGLDGALLNVSIKEKINSVIRKKTTEVKGQDILQRVYQDYQNDNFPEDYFVCLQMGILDLESLELQYNNVGFHIPPRLISETGEVSELVKQNLPISTVITEDLIDFSDKSQFLNHGDKLVLITDGLFEESVAGEMYGSKKLKQLLKKYYALPAELLVQVIERDFEEFMGDKYQENASNDDITLVVLESKSENRLEVEFNNKLSLLEEIETEIIGFLKDYNLPIIDIQLGLHEMLANAIEHGNQLKETKEVKVKVTVTKGYVRLIVADEGAGFDWQQKLTRCLEETGCQGRGRGIIITKQLFDQVVYNKKGNQICMIKFRE